jgi:catechol 2,3-dioxygenase
MRIDNRDERQFKIHPSMKIGYVSLNVSNIPRSIEFYQSVLGFNVMGKPSDGKALLSAAGGGSRLIELSQASEKEVQNIPKRAGLYHFAVLLPERKFLADMLQHLGEKRDQVHFEGMADHLVSESIYIRDPDLNGIEIYRDRPSSEWKWDGGSNNHVRMATERLNTEDLLKEMTEAGWKGMPAKTTIGHVHLHVSDLAKADKFYSESLGLNLTGTFPGAHFFAADRYHHHVATNTWLGKNIAAAASPEQIGLNHFGIELPSRQEFEETAERLAQHEAGMKQPELEGTRSSSSAFFQDGDGITVQLYCN